MKNRCIVFALSAFIFGGTITGPMSVLAGTTGIHRVTPLPSENTVENSEGLPGQTSSTTLDSPPKESGGWKRDEKGWWFRYEDQGTGDSASYPCNEWFFFEDEWYHFDSEGYMNTGWFEENRIRYYLDPESGKMLRDQETVIDGIAYKFDENGQCSLVWPWKRPVVIPAEEEKSDLHKAMDALCDNVLRQIISDGMSERQKVSAICNWIVSHFRYAGVSNTRDWVQEAYQGLRRHHGDCYTYFAVSQALLTRAGFPSIEVIRYTDNGHYWNLTKVDGNWYHFDTTPRTWRRSFCLLTDAEMLTLSAKHNGCFAFDRRLYPPTP